MSWLKPASNESGSAASKRVAGVVLEIATATLFAPATMLRCDSTTPLGLPVLPEV